MDDVKILNTNLKYIKVSNNYFEIKHFCEDHVIITYETCSLDDYILVRLDGMIVPNGCYIVKIKEETFMIFSPFEFDELNNGNKD